MENKLAIDGTNEQLVNKKITSGHLKEVRAKFREKMPPLQKNAKSNDKRERSVIKETNWDNMNKR